MDAAGATNSGARVLRGIAAARASVEAAAAQPVRAKQDRGGGVAVLLALGAAVAGGGAVLGIQALTGPDPAPGPAPAMAPPAPPLPQPVVDVATAAARLAERYDVDRDGSVEYPHEVRDIVSALFTLQCDAAKSPAVEARRPSDGSRPFDYRVTAWEYAETLRQFDTDHDGKVTLDELDDLADTIELLLQPPVHASAPVR